MHIKPNFQADYDVIVIGFGAAGASAARFAADSGQKVLLLDAASYGHEGGNTRYAGQIIGYTDDPEKMMKYYQNLTAPMNLPFSMIKTYVDGFAHMKEYFRKYLCKPVTYHSIQEKYPMLASMSPEYPTLEGSSAYDFLMVHEGFFDAAFWKLLRKKVLERSKQIDVWLNSRVVHLVQTNDETVIGVQVERDHKKVYVHARKGVVLALGGFENNREMVQNYLGVVRLVPVGSMYNRGDGIKLAQEVGAKLWHMWNYEQLGSGFGAGLTLDMAPGERGRLLMGWPQQFTGSVLTVGDDGQRYFNEAEPNKHGHIYTSGQWENAHVCQSPYLIFDQAQFEKIMNHEQPVPDLEERMIQAASLSDLAEKLSLPAGSLEKTVLKFNNAVDQGIDEQFGRDPKTMEKFGVGPYYALALAHAVLNTQGGPQRNEKAEILNAFNEPIPHLYGAGELGGISANQYQGGNNLAECLIWGKIAGEQVSGTDPHVADMVSTELNGINDLVEGERSEIEVGENQFLGSSEKGMGGRITTRVTYVAGQIKRVEIVESHESKDISQQALEKIPEAIVQANSPEVDVVTGASVTSRAIKDAVKNALKQA